LKIYGVEVDVIQAVQFDIDNEQEAQGLEHGTQSPLTKNLDESKQLKQKIVL
jgi:hypothetical protein